jgi:glutamine amidotransferase
MEVVIIKYNAGNIQSVLFALERLGIQALLTDDPERIAGADKVIFPGVGEASSAMKYLTDKKLDILIQSLKQPFLGICLGMQLMCRFSEEGNTAGLGLFDAEVKKFPPLEKVPHIGWNTIKKLDSYLFDGIAEESYFYFVHSYYAELSKHTAAETTYCLPFSSALQHANFSGVQFHPEKSGDAGEIVLKNFLKP